MLKAAGKQFGLIARNMHIPAHVVAHLGAVYEIAKARLPSTFSTAVADERTVADPSLNQPHALQLTIGPAHRARGHTELVREAVALRVPTGSPDAVRLEHRVAGADANPYLLLASVLAGVHHGLTNKVEPGAPIEGNSYEQLEPSLPNNLRDALRELDDSEILAKYIDPKYIDIFVACKESELARNCWKTFMNSRLRLILPSSSSKECRKWFS